MHMRTHDRFDVWIASSTRDSRNMSPPSTYKLLRLMIRGVEVDKVVFHEPHVRDNRYAIQVRSDLINGLLGAIGLNYDDVHLLPGTCPGNSKLFFTELHGSRGTSECRGLTVRIQTKVSNPASGMVSSGQLDEHVCRL